MSTDIIIGAELGPEFDQGLIQPNKTRIKLSTGLMNSLAGELMVNATVTKLPLYEYRDIWAEEGGALAANSSEWSFGDTGIGTKGLPISGVWEIIGMYIHADSFNSSPSVTVALYDWATTGNAASKRIATITMANATDGSGVNNHAWKYDDYNSAPIAIPTNPTILGFRTIAKSGTVSDARVGIRLRSKVGDYVSDVVFN